MRIGRIVSLVVVGLVLVVGAPTWGEQMATVKVGDIGIVADGPFYIGLEKGYYKERGIDLKLERFASAAGMMAPLSTGELQVAGGGISIALFNAFARGLPIKIVAARSADVPFSSSDTLIIRADLKDQLVRPRDLKGRKVAVNAKGSPLEYMLGKAMELDGLSFKDVDVVYIPFPDQGVALERKAIDAATNVEPFVTRFQEKGQSVIWKRAADFIKNPYMQVAVVFYNKDWAEKNPKLARDFMVAYIKASRDYYDAMVGTRGKAEVVEILTKYTPVKDRALYDRMHWSFQDPNGAIIKESIADQQDWYFRNGMLPQRVSVDDMIDERYLKAALEQLGTVPCEKCPPMAK